MVFSAIVGNSTCLSTLCSTILEIIMSKPLIIFGYHSVLAALRNRHQHIREILILNNRNDERMLAINSLASQCGVSVKKVALSALQSYVSEQDNHQGVVAFCKSSFDHTEQDIIPLIEHAKNPLFLILDGVQDPHNLGACLRSANAFGVTAVIAPKDNAVGLTSTVRKTACGGAESTPFIQVVNLARTIRAMQQEGVWFVGTDADAQESLFGIDLSSSIAIVLGNEEKGMRQLTKKHCDYVASIPLMGDVSSLNVSVATGIALYEASRQRAIVS